jgi:hypothetical protein
MQAVELENRVPGKAFMLVSVRGYTFWRRWPEFQQAIAQFRAPVTYILLDGLEQYNDAVIPPVATSKLADEVRTALKRLRSTPRSSMWSWADVERQTGFAVYREVVADCYRDDAHFCRETMNQSFRNLQPRLKAAEVRNSRDPRVRNLAQYLVYEIACKLLLTQEGFFQHELLPKPEMPLMRAIYEGGYRDIAALVRQRPVYAPIGPLWCATFGGEVER